MGKTFGVRGLSQSNKGTGVYGGNPATSGYANGVIGQTNSADGNGVVGQAFSTTGEAWGVLGESYSSSGTGVYGIAHATSGTTYGVYGNVNSPTGHSGYFTGGSFYINGPAKVNGLLSLENHMISNVANPVNALDAATKSYVDATGGLGGSGTLNYFPVFTAAKTLGNSIMRYSSDGLVGIGEDPTGLNSRFLVQNMTYVGGAGFTYLALFRVRTATMPAISSDIAYIKTNGDAFFWVLSPLRDQLPQVDP
jgi:hypothetical protein